MVAGGPRLAWLDAIRARHPLSLHGVAMSLAGAEATRCRATRGLAALVRSIRAGAGLRASGMVARGAARTAPTCCRSRARGRRCIASSPQHRAVQDALGRPIAIENPSHYLRLDGHEMDEIDFLIEIARRSGCTLLLDVNNVHVSANNLGFGPRPVSMRYPPMRHRNAPGRPQRRSACRRRAADRQPRRAGRRGGVGALRAVDRAHRPATDVDRARRERAGFRRTAGRARARAAAVPLPRAAPHGER